MNRMLLVIPLNQGNRAEDAWTKGGVSKNAIGVGRDIRSAYVYFMTFLVFEATMVSQRDI
jgi:hypothetical protein